MTISTISSFSRITSFPTSTRVISNNFTPSLSQKFYSDNSGDTLVVEIFNDIPKVNFTHILRSQSCQKDTHADEAIVPYSIMYLIKGRLQNPATASNISWTIDCLLHFGCHVSGIKSHCVFWLKKWISICNYLSQLRVSITSTTQFLQSAVSSVLLILEILIWIDRSMII